MSKMINKNITRITAVMCAGMILAANVTSAAAAEIPSKKEEVVYAMTDATGNVTGVYVVNTFAGGKITDYGEYASVRNMTSTDEISVSGDKITLETDESKVYYQGDLKTNDIPWNINIKYYCDGVEYSPADMAGKSGKLQIKISITQNDKCDTSFWEGYALQASLTLDSNKCQNIVAEDATIANVAADKQLSYIILPGKGKEIEISADVTDFEMDSININGVRLNLNMELDDSELKEKIKEIQDAVSELDSGAAQLNEGAESVNTGADKLNEGIASVNDALTKLNEQSASLNSGSAEVLNALTTIQSSLSNVADNATELKLLTDSSTQIKAGIDSLVLGLSGIDEGIDSYYSQLSAAGLSDSMLLEKNRLAMGALSQIPDEGIRIQLETLLKANSSYISGSSQLIGGIDTALDSQNGQLMTGVLTLQAKYAEFDKSIAALAASLSDMSGNMASLKLGIDTLTKNYMVLDSGVNEYTKAVAQILDGYQAIYEGAAQLSSGTYDLYTGTDELLSGTGEFQSQVANADTEISDAITDTIDTMTGKNVETVSFVSDKNTNVDSVLFVIKTQEIVKPEVEKEAVQTEEKLTFIQKLLKVFGL